MGVVPHRITAQGGSWTGEVKTRIKKLSTQRDSLTQLTIDLRWWGGGGTKEGSSLIQGAGA